MREGEERKGQNDADEKIRKLEDEKNALLDYIEESVNLTANNNENSQSGHRLTMNEQQNKIS